MTAVDARFAGGPIVVIDAPPVDVRPALIEVHMPGNVLELFPHEALQLAEALTAAVKEQARHLKRPAEVDDHLRQLDD